MIRINIRDAAWKIDVKMIKVDEIIPTRESLLSRLKDWGDQESWRVFFETYWKLIYNSAIKAGLRSVEAQDVVQETVISVMKSIRDFKYDSRKGSFKSWLLQLARWRAMDQLRKRQRQASGREESAEAGNGEYVKDVDEAVDTAESEFETAWEAEWENNLLEAAIDRVRRKVDARHFQIFDLYVQKQWPVWKVAQTLKVNAGLVYLVKHRISNAIKNEIREIKENPI
jgi:RNA polymerase sigma factor (sigma-70 family)